MRFVDPTSACPAPCTLAASAHSSGPNRARACGAGDRSQQRMRAARSSPVAFAADPDRISAPLGFKLASDIGEPRDGNGQHEMGPDRQAAGQYGPVVYGNQARWNIRPNNLLQQPHPPPKICSDLAS